MSNLVNRFDAKALDEEANWLNEFLAKILEARPEVKQALEACFKNCKANKYDDDIKKLQLEQWGGNDVCPSLEIVEIKGEYKFAMTHYGILGPICRTDSRKGAIKEVLMNFFINPLEYLQK